MNVLAEKLNKDIEKEHPFILEMLSDIGKELYYPKGILSQSAEANKQALPRFNATVGIATESGGPMYFDHIQEHFSGYAPIDIYPYAPPSGKQPLREAWKEKILQDNPSLKDKKFGLPIVTNALTHGLSIAADLFVDKGNAVVVPNKFWGNYNLTFGLRRKGNIVTFDLFNEQNKFNTEGLKEAIFQAPGQKTIVVLNFPNNPTGYTPTEEEAETIIAVLKEAAEENRNLVVLLDDAYFGLFYEDSLKESLFGKLIGLDPRILPVKIDGATKENYVWGLRVGFITYGVEDELAAHALEQKTMGLIRGTISSGPHLSQTVILQSLKSDRFAEEKQQKWNIMKARYEKMKAVIYDEKYKDAWEPYPFNSGYFMCIKLRHVNAETLRVHLLNKYEVGTIAVNDKDLRIAFSSVEKEDIEELIERIYNGVSDLT